MDEEECVTGVAGDSAHPLLRAVYLRRLRLTRLLLEGGAYINESDRHGQTPLMVACRTQHADGQSASRGKLLKYLLERGADPNIQDQDGRSALMHACREHAGPELVALLLAGGADLGLEDQSGTSALVYAVTAGDQKVLRLLLDAYKGQGKEVIIITTDSVPNGRARARQYRHGLAPHLALDVRASQAPASPSEIQIITSPLGTGPGSASGPHKQVFSFKENQCFACSGGNHSNPCSPTRLRDPGPQQRRRLPGRLQQQPLLRLNSEPWLKIPASAGSSRVPPAVAEPPPSLPENRPWESGPPKVEIFHGHPKPDASDTGRKASSSSSNSQNTYPPALVSYDRPRGPGIAMVTDGLNQSNQRSAAEKRGSQAGGGEEGAGEEALVRGGDPKRGHHTISLPGISSPHSASHPNLHTPQHPAGGPGPGGAVSPSASFSCGKTHGAALSGLDSIIHRRKLGADHYASDPQLTLKTASPEETQERARPPPAAAAGCRRLATLRSSTLGGSGFSASRESLEGPGPAARRAVPWFERRGSGAFLLDQGSGQYPPRSLPPLQLSPQYNHSPAGGGGGGRAARTAGHDPPCEKISGLKTFVPCAPPGPPKEVSRRALLRRHSMQSEQLKAA
ncbi:ankyrin repeat domain-containing protein 34B [Gadus morhua]|uniref:Ankyrin repeat domain 34Ba n=1 Tax=Gadus morhua TaxID=8049 RepID=A0A8C5CR43_GADMO|nr:ankyrin repeat domain-containing protein 34B-like [Gadus morhua]